jgi:hypothetical protein
MDAGITAVIIVFETYVELRRVFTPFTLHTTVAPGINMSPFIVMVTVGDPKFTVAGEIDVITAVGFVIVSKNEFDNCPFLSITEMFGGVLLVNSPAGTTAVMKLSDWNEEARGVLTPLTDQRTTSPDRNLKPATEMVVSGSNALIDAGVTEAIAGTSVVIVNGRLPEVRPRTFVTEIVAEPWFTKTEAGTLTVA